jgi:hypothetical protein
MLPVAPSRHPWLASCRLLGTCRQFVQHVGMAGFRWQPDAVHLVARAEPVDSDACVLGHPVCAREVTFGRHDELGHLASDPGTPPFPRPAFSQQYRGDVGRRDQIATRSYGPVSWDDRNNIGIEDLDQPIEHSPPNPPRILLRGRWHAAGLLRAPRLRPALVPCRNRAGAAFLADALRLRPRDQKLHVNAAGPQTPRRQAFVPPDCAISRTPAGQRRASRSRRHAPR